MAIVRTQVVIPRDTNLPEDVSTNTWHFRTPGAEPTGAELTAIDTGLGQFYGSVAPAVMSSLNANPVTFKHYALAHTKPRAPLRQVSFDLFYNSSAGPEEVAIVLSFQAVKASGSNQARRRNRVFIGPLGSVGQVVNGRWLISQGQREAITGAAATMRNYFNSGTTGVLWVVYSPVSNTSFEVDNGWVDDALDTQRRRGPRATTRSVFVKP